MESRVRLTDVQMVYGSGPAAVHALNDASLELFPGELAVVLGPSGSGKTTLLNVIGGIESPTAGAVVVDGQAITELSDDDRTEYRRTSVGFVFQFFNLIPNLTALENVELVAELLGARSDAAPGALEDVGLGDRLNHFPGSMSGGEQQRVAIARALVKNPPLLLCDEPTGSLDLDTGRHVLALLQDLPRQRATSVIVVTHNSAIAAIADRVVTMGSGRIAEIATNERPLAAEQLEW